MCLCLRVKALAQTSHEVALPPAKFTPVVSQRPGFLSLDTLRAYGKRTLPFTGAEASEQVSFSGCLQGLGSEAVLTCLRVAAGLKDRLRLATHPGHASPAACCVGSDASRHSVGCCLSCVSEGVHRLRGPRWGLWEPRGAALPHPPVHTLLLSGTLGWPRSRLLLSGTLGRPGSCLLLSGTLGCPGSCLLPRLAPLLPGAHS